MSSVIEIEQAISKLSPAEFLELERWFEEQSERQWDKQIETDSASGALDLLLREVKDDIEEGKTLPDNVLRDN